MFFYLKKIIGVTVTPIPLTLIAMLIAFGLISSKPKAAKLILLFATLFLGMTSCAPIADRIIAYVEGDYAVFDTRQPVDVVVVLGSGHRRFPNAPAVMQLSQSAVFRLEEGVRILKANPNAMLFVSGKGSDKSKPHAEMMQEAAIELGVSSTRIKAFPLARDTEEEAKMMAPYLKNHSVALVTEASHMKRALVYFENAGIHPIPAPAFKLGAGESVWRINANATHKSERAFYELLGRSWQEVKNLFR